MKCYHMSKERYCGESGRLLATADAASAKKCAHKFVGPSFPIEKIFLI